MAQGFENVRLTIAENSPMIRVGLKAALHGHGFRAINDTANYLKLRDLIAQDAFDLLITSSELENQDVGYLVRELRDHRLGTNPFAVVIVLLSNAEPQYVRNIIDSGADDILLTPVAPEQLMARVEKLAAIRKPFVVTHDYTGPDRRKNARAFVGPSAPMLEIPNPLRARLQDGRDGTRLQAQISEATRTLNRLKLERLAVQVDWLVNHVHANLRDGVANADELAQHTHRLVEVASDMIRRLHGTAMESMLPVVEQLLATARQVDAQPTTIAFSSLEQMHETSKAVGRLLGTAPVLAP